MDGERNYLDLDDDDSAAGDRTRSLIGWGLMVAAGLVVWELTDRSGLAASVACLKFGADEAATGLYLLRKDPHRGRGWACCTFHLARGCARFGSIGFGASLLAEAAEDLLRRIQGLPAAPRGANDIAVNVLILSLCGLFTWVILSGVGTYLAFSGELRVWIDPTTRDSRRTGLWPPQPWGRNRMRFSVIVAAAGLMHLVGLGALAAIAGGWLLLLTIPFSAGLGWLVARRIEARVPEDCWPELLISTVDDADYAGRNAP